MRRIQVYGRKFAAAEGAGGRGPYIGGRDPRPPFTVWPNKTLVDTVIDVCTGYIEHHQS